MGGFDRSPPRPAKFFGASLAVLALVGVWASAAGASEVSSDRFYVILIEDSFVYINAGQDQGVRMGDMFTVVRPGKAIVDPETGDTLGSDPVPIAKLRVMYVAPHYSKTYAMEVVENLVVQVRDSVMRYEGEKIGAVPAPLVVPLEREERPVEHAATGGDKIFVEKQKRGGDVIGDFSMEGEILDYDFGDVDGDGVPDLATLELRKVKLYRVMGGKTQEIWSETLKGFQYVNLELFDADGDGKEEIFIGQKQGNTARTDVYQYKDGHLNKRGEMKGVFVRQNADALYAQHYGFAKPFSGPVMEVKYNPATNAVTQVRDVYEGPANVLGLGIGKTRMAFLDYNDRLSITDRSSLIVWRGVQPLGGSTQEIVSGNGREKEKIQKKIMFDDFEGNGTEELLVVKNDLNPLWGVTGIIGGGKFRNGKFVIYADHPGGYDVVKETREFEGYISDFEYTKVGGFDRQLSLCIVAPAGRQKFKSRIIVLREL